MANSRICSIPDCGKSAMLNGLCVPHDRRRKMFGDPTKGKVVQGTAARYFREVLLPYDGDDCLLWPFTKTHGGYATLHIGGRHRYVSRMLCEAEYGPAPSPEYHAAHSCGKGSSGCCTKRHLRWATPAENIQDKFLHGTVRSGERVPNSKLTVGEVARIRTLKGSMAQKKIAKMFGVSQTLISQIFRNKIWRS